MMTPRILHSNRPGAPFTAVIFDARGLVSVARSFSTREGADRFLRDHLKDDAGNVNLLSVNAFETPMLFEDHDKAILGGVSDFVASAA
jgi:hypothetical protein